MTTANHFTDNSYSAQEVFLNNFRPEHRMILNEGGEDCTYSTFQSVPHGDRRPRFWQPQVQYKSSVQLKKIVALMRQFNFRVKLKQKMVQLHNEIAAFLPIILCANWTFTRLQFTTSRTIFCTRITRCNPEHIRTASQPNFDPLVFLLGSVHNSLNSFAKLKVNVQEVANETGVDSLELAEKSFYPRTRVCSSVNGVILNTSYRSLWWKVKLPKTTNGPHLWTI